MASTSSRADAALEHQAGRLRHRERIDLPQSALESMNTRVEP